MIKKEKRIAKNIIFDFRIKSSIVKMKFHIVVKDICGVSKL